MLMTTNDRSGRNDGSAPFAPRSSPSNRVQRGKQRGRLPRPRRWVPKRQRADAVSIERKVERAVRRTLAAAVAGDVKRFDDDLALTIVTGKAFSTKALNLAAAIGTVTLRSIHHGIRPDHRQIDRLTREFAVYEHWAGFDPDLVHTYLIALADQQPPLERLRLEDAQPAVFLVGGWLLSAFLPDDVQWTDFLDGVLDRLENSNDGRRLLTGRAVRASGGPPAPARATASGSATADQSGPPPGSARS
jgi:hypothetical protein